MTTINKWTHRALGALACALVGWLVGMLPALLLMAVCGALGAFLADLLRGPGA